MKWTQNTKEVAAYCFASFALICGFGLTIAGFIVDPLGIISESVLWCLSQTLVFAGAVTGVSLHVNNSMRKMEAALFDKLKKEKETDQ